MAFKLRSNHRTPFKQMGEKKETPTEYNTRVTSEYDSKLQSHTDSTASYKQAVKVDRAYADIYKPGLRLGGTKGLRKANDLEQEMKKNPIHPTTKRRGKVIPAGFGGYNLIFNKTASDVKPGPAPRKPITMIEPIGIKTLPGSEEPKLILPSKRKYIKGVNLETGEKRKLSKKTKKVKKVKRPRKRKILNLVTGKKNRVQ